MSHLKYPHLELDPLYFGCFLYHDFKDDPRIPNPGFCRTPSKEHSPKSLYAFSGRKEVAFIVTLVGGGCPQFLFWSVLRPCLDSGRDSVNDPLVGSLSARYYHLCK